MKESTDAMREQRLGEIEARLQAVTSDFASYCANSKAFDANAAADLAWLLSELRRVGADVAIANAAKRYVKAVTFWRTAQPDDRDYLDRSNELTASQNALYDAVSESEGAE